MTTVLRWVICALAFAFVMQADPVSYLQRGSWTSTAEARIGRPATPVSVAGAARRTVRRCAVGVYNC